MGEGEVGDGALGTVLGEGDGRERVDGVGHGNCGGGRGGSGRGGSGGRAQEPRERAGRVGGGIEEERAWRPYLRLVADERVRRGRAPVPSLVGGTGKGRERPSEVCQAGWAWGSAQLGQGPVGGFLFPFFLFVFSFVFSFHFIYFLFCFTSF